MKLKSLFWNQICIQLPGSETIYKGWINQAEL